MIFNTFVELNTQKQTQMSAQKVEKVEVDSIQKEPKIDVDEPITNTSKPPKEDVEDIEIAVEDVFEAEEEIIKKKTTKRKGRPKKSKKQEKAESEIIGE